MSHIAPQGYTYIYTLSDRQGVRYIGKATNLKQRYSKHLKESKLKRTIKEKWIDSRLSNGEEIYMEAIDTVPQDSWSFHEIYWIQQFKAWGFSLVNGTDGGEGSNGFKGKTHSPETRAKLALCRAGQTNNSSCPGEKNGRAKLTRQIVDEIRSTYEEGTISQRALAAKYGIARINIKKILDQVYWK